MKIICGMLGHETNTFSAEMCDFARWSQTGWFHGEEVIRGYEGKGDYISGMIDVARKRNIELIPTMSVLDAGPMLLRETVDYAMGMILEVIEAHKDEIDGICFALHGAGCAEGIECLEKHTLEKMRGIVGDELPIMITLDLHANMSDAVVNLTNGMFGIKQYPHTDKFEAGQLAMECLANLIEKKASYYTAHVKLPLLVPAPLGNTYTGPMKKFTDYSLAFREEKSLVDATVLHGFPYADRPQAGMSIITVSDKSQEHADETARELARFVWENRWDTVGESLSAKEAVDRALEIAGVPGEGYVVINETSDNPGGGTPCDGTGLLKELLSCQGVKSILAYIHDEEIALAAHAAGVGGKVSGLLGAKADTLHGEPIEIKDAYVAALSDGHCIYNTPVLYKQKICYGKSARLTIGSVDVVVCENLAQQTFDNMPFVMVGADIDQYDLVCVKSSNHFRAWFESRAKGIVAADPPGIQTANLLQLPFKNVIRPAFPLDPDMELKL